MLKIEPIKLLSGSHADTGATGQGCFMNIVAYLNGEAQITDKSPCVCVTIRPIAVWLNDYLRDEERARMIPYIERAIGSATMEKAELVRRAWLAADMAKTMSTIAASEASEARAARAASAASEASAASAAWAARAASEASAAWAAWPASAARAARAARAASAESAESAESAASAASAARAVRAASAREVIIEACFTFLDAALPKSDITDPIILQRANALLELANAH